MPKPPDLPASIRDLIERLRRAHLEVVLVGGAVRDAWLGRPLRDVDLVVRGSLAAAAGALPEAVRIDAHTPVLALPAGAGRPRVEIAALHADAQTFEEDLAQRDFTCNAIAFDPARGVWLDPTGGRRDLEAGRLASPAPDASLRADPVRVLRGVRLCRELELEVEPRTERAFWRFAPLLSTQPGERLREELFRLLGQPEPSRSVALLRRVGALAPVLPELLRGVGIAQNRHHSDDVYTHSLAVCDGVRGEPLLRLAALLHDVAKPDTKRFEPQTGEPSFHRHDVAAAVWIQRVARRLRLSRRAAQRLERLVRHHLLFPERLETPAALRRMLRRVGTDILDDLLELRRADLASRQPTGEPPVAWLAAEERIRTAAAGARSRGGDRLAIGGADVLRALGLEEGPDVGRWLARLRRHVVEHPEDNRRERLLAWLDSARDREHGQGGG